ncbi:glycosyltransferase family 2 protein [Tannerella sp.]|uniref:glycosyltransferase family 2 protein n=1 Tax=Tannerella sp. TaxID=2382127 RepID=UPI0026DAD72F|nr:glycosyltransferase family 2 protein [Tannerella sp.]MDO4702532.1 glycosyltransferase family 2 protein [Tannerella sp.]
MMPDRETDIRPGTEALSVCVIIPTYNNAKTLREVLDAALRQNLPVIVVNDGSTDETAAILTDFAGRVEIISYHPNKGKGHALKNGFDRAEKLGYAYAITMDSDGQHAATDIARFTEALSRYPDALIIGQRIVEGNMPPKNSFANQFSNFWFAVQTARRLRDTQNGFRLYPLRAMKGMRPFSSRYEAELELLVRCRWKGIRIVSVPTHVYYAPEGERVTHFRPGKDFVRISVLNTILVIAAMLYGYPSMLYHSLFKRSPKP